LTGSLDSTKPGDPSHDQASGLDDVVSGALRGLFGRDSLYMLLWFVQLVAAALITPVMTRMLDSPNFGRVAAATAVMQVLFVLMGLGLHQAIQRQYALDARSPDPAKLLSISIVVAALLAAVADATGPLWARQVGFQDYGGPVRIAVLWAALSAITYSALALLRSQDRLLAFSIVTLLQSVVAAVTSLLLVLLLDNTATMYLLGQVIVQAVAAIVALVLIPPRLPRVKDRTMVKGALAFGWPLIPALLSRFVLDSSDRLIIQMQLGSSEVGRYQVAYNVGALPMLLLGILNQSWMPRIFSLKKVDERAAVISASRDLLYMLLMPVLVGLAVGAPLLLRIWAPPSYQPETLLMVTSIVLISAIPYTAGLSSIRVLMAEGRTGSIALAQVIAAGGNIALNLALIPHFGLEGSAAATLLAMTMLHVLMLWARARALVKVKPPSARLLFALFATAGVSVGVATAPAERFIIFRLLVVFATVVWFCLIFATKTGIVRDPRIRKVSAPERIQKLP
jgi:O-antigen/teichoic acid export membrane protein